MIISPINQSIVGQVLPVDKDPKTMPVVPVEVEEVKMKDDAVIVEISEKGRALASGQISENEDIITAYGADMKAK